MLPCLQGHSQPVIVAEAVFEVPVAGHWLAKKEALAVAIAMFMALALSHHVID